MIIPTISEWETVGFWLGKGHKSQRPPSGSAVFSIRVQDTQTRTSAVGKNLCSKSQARRRIEMKLFFLCCAVWLTSGTLAAEPACSQGIYSALAGLDGYAPAESYCSSRYSRTVTVTANAPTRRKRSIAERQATSANGIASTMRTSVRYLSCIRFMLILEDHDCPHFHEDKQRFHEDEQHFEIFNDFNDSTSQHRSEFERVLILQPPLSS